MRKLFCLMFLVIACLGARAQRNGSIKGLAFDSIAKQAVPSATVTILDKKDSSLVSFTMTDNTGNFELGGLPDGEYRLMISHVNFHTYNTPFTIKEQLRQINLGQVQMLDAAKVLGEVVVTSAPPVTMIGDTVQYNAGSFKVPPNASVEQLLKKLPGVKVDKDGTITAQGEKATRVLVDGKEFFGNDPKIATRNLPADAVDKVQVYDKQSEQASLTGFNDGNYEKTINLKLKSDKKKGAFGKVMAGAGDRERYEGRFNINSFKGARQLSAIGMGNNINAETFSFMDILSFSGGLNQMSGGGGVMSLSMSASDAAAYGLGNGNSGINTAWGGGVNYNNIIGKDLDFQSSYFYNRFNPNIRSRLVRQNFIPGGSNFYDQNSYSDNLNNTNRLNLNLFYQIDTFHSIRFTPSISYQKSNNRSETQYTTRQENGSLINEGFSNNTSLNEGFNFSNDLTFRKKFRRKGRTFSASLNTSVNDNEGDGSISSIINYYNNNAIARRDTLDQRFTNEGALRGYRARLVYTEPLWKKSLLELSAGNSSTRNVSEKITRDYNNTNGKYDQVNEQLSNEFQNTYGYTTGGARLRKQGRKYEYSLGLTWQKAMLEGLITNGIKDSLITQDFNNLLPNASFKYNFTRYKSAGINYTASTNQPSMQQLQPVPDVSNPLYILEGNPDLKQEYNHTATANLRFVSPYRNKNLFVFLTASTTRNKIVNNDTVDIATGIRRTRPVNVNGVYMLMNNITYSMPVRFLKGNFEIGNRTMFNNGKQFINNLGNTIRTLQLAPMVRLDINPSEKINIATSAEYQINKTTYSVQPALNNNYLSQEYSTTFNAELPKRFNFWTEFTYTINSQRADGFNTNVPMWNASLSKLFLKNNRGELKISATDILNRNTGISRTTNQNYIEDREINILRRFFMLSFTYSLSKTGLNGGAGGIQVIRR